MLRSKKFRRYEVKLLVGMAVLLMAVAVVGTFAGISRGDWRVLCASGGIGGLATFYFFAARRGRPL